LGRSTPPPKLGCVIAGLATSKLSDVEHHDENRESRFDSTLVARDTFLEKKSTI
jgi:hypothetical protein